MVGSGGKCAPDIDRFGRMNRIRAKKIVFMTHSSRRILLKRKGMRRRQRRDVVLYTFVSVTGLFI